MRDCGVCTSMGQFWLYRYLSPDMRVSVQYMSGDRGVMCVKQQCFSERGLLMQLLGDSISNGKLVCACTLTGNVCPASQVLEACKALVDSNVWSGFLLNGRIVKHQACQTCTFSVGLAGRGLQLSGHVRIDNLTTCFIN